MPPATRVTRTNGFGFSISAAVARAISSGSAFRKPFAPSVPATSSVLVNVGRTVETLIPVLRYSSRTASVNPITACLVPTYVARPGTASSPASEAVLMMCPRSRGSIRSSACLVP